MGEPERGEWCDNCLLPSALKTKVACVSGMKVLGIMEMIGCPECQQVSRTWVQE